VSLIIQAETRYNLQDKPILSNVQSQRLKEATVAQLALKYFKYQVNIMIKVRPRRILYRNRSKKLPASLELLSAGSFNEKVHFCLRFLFAMR